MRLYAFGVTNQKAQFNVASATKKFNGLCKRKFKDRTGFQMDAYVCRGSAASS